MGSGAFGRVVKADKICLLDKIGELFVMVEYCRNGSLKSFIMSHRNRFVNQVGTSGNLSAVCYVPATEISSSSDNHESE